MDSWAVRDKTAEKLNMFIVLSEKDVALWR